MLIGHLSFLNLSQSFPSCRNSSFKMHEFKYQNVRRPVDTDLVRYAAVRSSHRARLGTSILMVLPSALGGGQGSDHRRTHSEIAAGFGNIV